MREAIMIVLQPIKVNEINREYELYLSRSWKALIHLLSKRK
jgi:hypothetical protein